MKKHMGFRGTVSALVLIAIGVAGGTSAWAQDADGQGATYLDEIILVGTGLPTEVMDSPASVTVMGEEDIKRVPPSSVARILSDIPGVRVYESGIERIMIRGESSHRVAIMIDGQQINDHYTYGTPILISPAAIERIEVVRGPSSVVSGNRAIGGVVNIITKRGADVPFQLTTQAGYMSATDGWRASANLQGAMGNLDYRLTFSQSDLGDRKAVSGTLSPSGIEDRDLSLHLGYEVGNHYFGLRAQDFDLAADVWTEDPRFFSVDLPQRDLRKYAIFYEGTDLTPWMSSLKIDAYTQTVDRYFINKVTFPDTGPGPIPAPPPWPWRRITSDSTDEQTTSGLQIKTELDLAAGHRTVLGFDYEHDNMIADKTTLMGMYPGYVGVTPPPGDPVVNVPISTRYSDATIKTFSLYAQHEWTVNDSLTATFGARYYEVQSDLDTYRVNGVDAPTQSNSDSRLLGSFGLVYKPAEDTTLRASISQGYTYPSLSELYLTTTAGGGTTIGNPDLKPETSTSYEIGARLDRGLIMLDGTLFYTDAKDYIARLPTANPLDPDEMQYQNVAGAKTFGAELGVELDSGIWGLRPHASLAYIKREFTYANGYSTYDTGTAALSGTIGVRRDWELGNMYGELDLYLSGESGSILRDSDGTFDPAEDVYNGYATLNLRGSAQLTDNLELTFEVGNILDKQYMPRLQLEGSGRNVSVFLTATF